MITPQQLDDFKTWFHAHVHSFALTRDDQRFNFELKEAHTGRVCTEMLELGRSENLDTGQLRLAESIALFHDVGRFVQYHQYGTFLDFKSTDHGRLGVEALAAQHVLDSIDPQTRDLIIFAVAHHNRAALPEDETPERLYYARMVRDADKLDIGRIYSTYYHDPSVPRSPALELELPDLPEITPAIYEDLLAGRRVKNIHIRTLNDLKLVQMGQVLDMNYHRTFALVAERGYLEKIYAALPQTAMTQAIYTHMRTYLDGRLQVLPENQPPRCQERQG
jgi:hypothetical protein